MHHRGPGMSTGRGVCREKEMPRTDDMAEVVFGFWSAYCTERIWEPIM
jgi:hypothetical protein